MENRNGPEDDLFEKTKLAIDVVKHMSTLATGAVVLLTTLLDKLPKPPAAPIFLVLAVSLFAICVIFCFIYLFLAGMPRRWGGRTGQAQALESELTIVSLITYLTFIVGMICLFVFSVSNINRLMG